MSTVADFERGWKETQEVLSVLKQFGGQPKDTTPVDKTPVHEYPFHSHALHRSRRTGSWICDVCACCDSSERYRCRTCTEENGDSKDWCAECIETPTTLDPRHPHPLREFHDNHNWQCDDCGMFEREKRYRCTEGCDFDLCLDCAREGSQRPFSGYEAIFIGDVFSGQGGIPRRNMD